VIFLWACAGLFWVYIGLVWVYIGLFSVYMGLFWVHMGFLDSEIRGIRGMSLEDGVDDVWDDKVRVYMAHLNVHRALLNVHRALLNVHRALFSTSKDVFLKYHSIYHLNLTNSIWGVDDKVRDICMMDLMRFEEHFLWWTEKSPIHTQKCHVYMQKSPIYMGPFECISRSLVRFECTRSWLCTLIKKKSRHQISLNHIIIWRAFSVSTSYLWYELWYGSSYHRLVIWGSSYSLKRLVIWVWQAFSYDVIWIVIWLVISPI